MSPRNEEVEAVLRELDAYGLKGRILPLSKHIAVTWALADGRTRSQVCPLTGSDRRGWLNARARVRRQLREDGVVRPSPEKRILEKALSLPKPSESGDVRLARLEQDNEALLDWLLEMQDSVQQLKQMLLGATATVTLNFGQLQAARTESLEEEVVAEGKLPAPQPPKTFPPLRRGQPDVVLGVLSNNWQHLNEIEKAVNLIQHVNRASMGTVLSRLKRDGMVESGQRGYWRLAPGVRVNGTAIATNSVVEDTSHVV